MHRSGVRTADQLSVGNDIAADIRENTEAGAAAAAGAG